MLISHRYRFIFIHVQKTGGTSISAALEPYCEETLGQMNARGFPSHASAGEIRRAVGARVWDSYFKFAFERNPWDKVLSSYFYQLEHWDKFRKPWRPRRPRSLHHWLFPLGIWRKRLAPSFPMYSIAGRSAIDYLGRYESLQADFSEICRKIGLPELTLPTRNKSSLRPEPTYREHYTPRSRERVGRVYWREIEALKYAF